MEEARREISAALREEGLPEHWEEWGQMIGDEQTFGSPTVTVDGRDVASGDLARRTASGSCCRVYVDGNSLRGAPSCETIREALRTSRN